MRKLFFLFSALMLPFAAFGQVIMPGVGLVFGSNASGSGGGGTVTSITNSDGSLSLSPNPIVGAGKISLNLGNANTWAAAQTFPTSDIILGGSSTGTTTFASANAGASNFTITFPAATGTVALTSGVPAGANPTASIGTTAVNGSASTFLRSDGAPALDQTAAWNFSHSTGVPIHGTNTNDAASAGYVGEYVTASAARNVFSFSSGSVSNVVSISLTAGDWLVSGNTLFTVLSGTELVTRAQCGISTTSVTLPSQVSPSYWAMAYLLSPDQDFTGNGMTRVSLASTTTVYLVAQINWSGGTGVGGGGSIQAWRIR